MATQFEKVLDIITSIVFGENVHVILAGIGTDENDRQFLDIIWLVNGTLRSGIKLKEGNVDSGMVMLPVSAREQVRNILSSQRIDGPFRHELLSAGLLQPTINDIPL